MTIHAPALDLLPKVFRFTDVDQFRSSVRNLDVDFTPLVRKISAEQTILNLQGCDINLTRSFPRIMDGRVKPNCTAVGFSMDDGFPIRFNGIERDHCVIVIGSNGAAFSSVERVERSYASIIFSPAVEDRGWPQATQSFRMFETSASAQQSLRRLVGQILSVSPDFTAPYYTKEASSAIRESLLAAIDAAFADVVPIRWTVLANSARQFKIFRNIGAALADNVGSPIYSEELAQQIGVSVRTMHDAVLRYRGMSLHRYLRLRRLWLVRQRLLIGGDSVKAIALAFGFWHLGDFSKSYRLQFDESPSQTLTRSRRA